MGVVETLHEAHKARQARIRQAALKAVTEPVKTEPGPAPAPDPDPIHVIAVNPGYRSKFEVIITEVCAYYKVSRQDLLSTRRMFDLSQKRHMLVYLMHTLTTYTNPQIGDRVKRDPTSVGYAIKKVVAERETRQTEIDDLTSIITPLLPSL